MQRGVKIDELPFGSLDLLDAAAQQQASLL